MGTCSYVLTGTDKGFAETFGSTCHGAGQAFLQMKRWQAGFVRVAIWGRLVQQLSLRHARWQPRV